MSHHTHAILIAYGDTDLPMPDDQLREAAVEYATFGTDRYCDTAFDYRDLLTDEDAKEQGLPGAVILGQTSPETFLGLVDEWASKPLAAALALLNAAMEQDEVMTVTPAMLRMCWDGQDHTVLRLWRLRRALSLAEHRYLVEAEFFSEPDGCTKLESKTRDAIAQDPSRYALVFMRYHW